MAWDGAVLLIWNVSAALGAAGEDVPYSSKSGGDRRLPAKRRALGDRHAAETQRLAVDGAGAAVGTQARLERLDPSVGFADSPLSEREPFAGVTNAPAAAYGGTFTTRP